MGVTDDGDATHPWCSSYNAFYSNSLLADRISKHSVYNHFCGILAIISAQKTPVGSPRSFNVLSITVRFLAIRPW